MTFGGGSNLNAGFADEAVDIITDPLSRALILAFVGVLTIGAVFYQIVEGWGWINSFYFCAVTLTTIGYGDLHPTTDVGKVFTIFYCIIGIGIVATFITGVASRAARRIELRVERRIGRRSDEEETR
ncbi:MAG TPA: potassium channel family protein [Dehalococcoidia bacterium]